MVEEGLKGASYAAAEGVDEEVAAECLALLGPGDGQAGGGLVRDDEVVRHLDQLGSFQCGRGGLPTRLVRPQG